MSIGCLHLGRQFRPKEEYFWTALALGCCGLVTLYQGERFCPDQWKAFAFMVK
jgi:hypothetical protein